MSLKMFCPLRRRISLRAITPYRKFSLRHGAESPKHLEVLRLLVQVMTHAGADMTDCDAILTAVRDTRRKQFRQFRLYTILFSCLQRPGTPRKRRKRLACYTRHQIVYLDLQLKNSNETRKSWRLPGPDVVSKLLQRCVANFRARSFIG